MSDFEPLIEKPSNTIMKRERHVKMNDFMCVNGGKRYEYDIEIQSN